MRRFLVAFAVVAMSACANATSPLGPGSTGSPEPSPSPGTTPVDTLRVDLVEAGLRAVLPSDGGRELLFIRSELCETTFTSNREKCEGTLSEEEQAMLADRLQGAADQIRFVSSYEEIDDGQAPIDHPGHVFAWVGLAELQGDGTYWVEAGETCGGLCGHGGTYVLEPKVDGWVSAGTAPGTGSWIS